jgi:hypothetical protein
MKVKKFFPLLISLTLFSISTSLNAFDQLSNVYATSRFYDDVSESATTPSSLVVTPSNTYFMDGDELNYSDWMFEVYVNESEFPEYFYFNDGDFQDYFYVSVIRNGLQELISNSSNLYYFDTDIIVEFINPYGSNLDYSIDITVDRMDPLFTNFDPPSSLSVETNGFTNFTEGDYIDYSLWDFYVYLESGNFVILDTSDHATYLSFYETSSLMQGDYSVGIDFYSMLSGSFLYTEVFISVAPLFVDPIYSIIVHTTNMRTTYFVGDTLNLTNLEIDLYDDGFFLNTLYANSVGISLTNGDGFFIGDGAGLAFDDAYITVTYDDGMGFSATDTFTLTILPLSYRYDFSTASVWQDIVSESEPAEETYGNIGDTWLVSGVAIDEGPLVAATNGDSLGLIFGDNTLNNYPESISLMSKHLWGVYGSAGQDFINPTSGMPIIQNVYVKAFTSSGGSAELSIKINNVLISTLVIDDEIPFVDEWYTFTTTGLPPQIGHIEFVINVDAAEPAVVFLQEIVIDSNNDSTTYPNLSPMLKFASEMESLDTCVNQEEFLETNQFDYQSYLGAADLDGIFENLLLLDHITTGDAKSQLVVNTVNKWNMMVTQYVDTDESGPLFASNRITEINNMTMHYFFGSIFVLLQLFWIGRRFYFLNKEIRQ